MARGYRPAKRLITKKSKLEGKAAVATKKQFKNILWNASRGDLGYRNVAIVWMLFGSGCRISEVAKLKINDLIRPTGELKTTFTIKGKYTKTGKARAGYILARSHIRAVERWICELIEEKVCLSGEDSFRGLRKDWPIFAITKKGKDWRKISPRQKKYTTTSGEVRTTEVYNSLRDKFSQMFKDSGLIDGSTHSGRRTLASWLDHNGVELETIQRILGHEHPDQTVEYIDPNYDRIKEAFSKTLVNIEMPELGKQLISEYNRDK